MHIFIGIIMLLISFSLFANVVNSLSGRYGSHNKGWNVILAGVTAAVGIVGAFRAFFTDSQVAFGMLLLMLAVWSGLVFIGVLTGRYSGPNIPGVSTGVNKGVAVALLAVSAGAFFGASKLI